MSAGHRTQVCTGGAAVEWSRLVADLERFGLLAGPGACDAVARVGADVLDRSDAAHETAADPQAQADAP